MLNNDAVVKPIFEAVHIPWDPRMSASTVVTETQPPMLMITISGTIAMQVEDPTGRVINRQGSAIPDAEYVYADGYPQQIIIIPGKLSGDYKVTAVTPNLTTYSIGVLDTAKLTEIDQSVSADDVWITVLNTEETEFLVNSDKIEPVDGEDTLNLYLPLIQR